MKHEITHSTDDQFLGHKFDDTEPIVLNGSLFSPDKPKLSLGNGEWRFYNSNYSLDTKEVIQHG